MLSSCALAAFAALSVLVHPSRLCVHTHTHTHTHTHPLCRCARFDFPGVFRSPAPTRLQQHEVFAAKALRAVAYAPLNIAQPPDIRLWYACIVSENAPGQFSLLKRPTIEPLQFNLFPPGFPSFPTRLPMQRLCPGSSRWCFWTCRTIASPSLTRRSRSGTLPISRASS